MGLNREGRLPKVLIGKGTLIKFSQDYELINQSEEQVTTASTFNVVGLETEGEMKGMLVYEYIIYYNINPNALKSLDESGKVVTGPEIKL